MNPTAVAAAVEDFLSSSSSSADEEEDLLMNLEKEDINKITNYIDIVNQNSDKQFKENFRMERRTFEKLPEKFERSSFNYELKSHPGSIGVNCKNQLLAFLWFSGNKCSLRDVSSRFNIAVSTLHKIISNVTDFLLEIAPSVIRFPQTDEEKRRVATEFEVISGFPNVLGCIDGSYITIRTPAGKLQSCYVNRHDQPSLTLQGICDAQRKFLDVFTWSPGKIHDARVFRLSFISNNLQNLCNNGDPWHILADSAYPLRKWMLTPYRDYGNLSGEQINYNRCHCSTRVRIENSFGILKQRFRQIHQLMFWTVERMSKFIIACCVLHNICIVNDDIWDHVDVNVGLEEENPVIDEPENLVQQQAIIKRDFVREICDYLMNN